jgi:hypothetical protein
MPYSGAFAAALSSVSALDFTELGRRRGPGRNWVAELGEEALKADGRETKSRKRCPNSKRPEQPTRYRRSSAALLHHVQGLDCRRPSLKDGVANESLRVERAHDVRYEKWRCRVRPRKGVTEAALQCRDLR